MNNRTRIMAVATVAAMAIGHQVGTTAVNAMVDTGKDTMVDITPGDDTAALIAVIDSLTPRLCALVDDAIAAGNDPQTVVDHGVISFELTFDPTSTVVEHMRTVLTICAFGLT